MILTKESETFIFAKWFAYVISIMAGGAALLMRLPPETIATYLFPYLLIFAILSTFFPGRIVRITFFSLWAGLFLFAAIALSQGEGGMVWGLVFPSIALLCFAPPALCDMYQTLIKKAEFIKKLKAGNNRYLYRSYLLLGWAILATLIIYLAAKCLFFIISISWDWIDPLNQALFPKLSLQKISVNMGFGRELNAYFMTFGCMLIILLLFPAAVIAFFLWKTFLKLHPHAYSLFTVIACAVTINFAFFAVLLILSYKGHVYSNFYGADDQAFSLSFALINWMVLGLIYTFIYMLIRKYVFANVAIKNKGIV